MAVGKKVIGLFWQGTQKKPVGQQMQSLAPLSSIDLARVAVGLPVAAEKGVQAMEPENPFVPNLRQEVETAINKMPALSEFLRQLEGAVASQFKDQPEKIQYSMALLLAQTALKATGQSLTAADPVTSIDGLGKVLESERLQFQSANAESFRNNSEKLKAEIGSTTTEIATTNQQVKVIEDQIAKLMADKQLLVTKAAELEQKKKNKQQELDSLSRLKDEREQQFNVALHIVKADLEVMKQKFQANLS